MRVYSAQRLVQRKLSTVSRPYFVPYNLSFVQRAFLVPYFGLGAIADPRRGDLVAGLGDATSERQLLRIKSLLMESSAGRKLMREKPLITESSLQLSTSDFPDDSLGKKYSEFMKVNNFSTLNLLLMI
jgi:ubiquinone biosynthesis protein COQ4